MRIERRLVAAIDRRLDSAAAPGRALLFLDIQYLRLRHAALHRAIAAGRLWSTSAWRVGVAMALTPGGVCLDLGANLGRVTQEAAWRVGPQGKVHAFEPAPVTVERLERRITRLGLGQVVVNRIAVGAAAGEGTLHFYPQRAGGASSLRPLEHAGIAPAAMVTVPVVSLDGYCSERGLERVDLIKIDIEGSEVEALEGASRLLSGARRPVLVVEAAPITQASFGRSVEVLLAQLAALGYACYACRRKGAVRVRTEADLGGRRREDLLAVDPGLHAELYQRLERRRTRSEPSR